MTSNVFCVPGVTPSRPSSNPGGLVAPISVDTPSCFSGDSGSMRSLRPVKRRRRGASRRCRPFGGAVFDRLHLAPTVTQPRQRLIHVVLRHRHLGPLHRKAVRSPGSTCGAVSMAAVKVSGLPSSSWRSRTFGVSTGWTSCRAGRRRPVAARGRVPRRAGSARETACAPRARAPCRDGTRNAVLSRA